MIPLCENDAVTVMNTFRGIAKRVVAISSCDVYRAYGRLTGLETGPPDPDPLTETSPLREKLYPYRGKIAGMDDYDKIPVERIVLGAPDLPGTVLRLPMVYGPRDRQRRFHRFIKRIDDGRPAILFNELEAVWRCSMSYVDNVAHAIATAITDARTIGRIYNVAEPDTLSQIEWARTIGTATGWQGECIVLPEGVYIDGRGPDEDFHHHLAVDSARIRSELGFTERVNRQEAIRRTIEWERAYPPEQYEDSEFNYDAEDQLLEELSGRQT
jgi:nucleoside-diphosphate-sugar epimerase